MSDKSVPVIRYGLLFIVLYVSYKTINIADACVRTYLIRKYHVYVEDYPAISIESFFADDDLD